MKAEEQDEAARAYFAERYEIIARYPLIASRPILIPVDNVTRRLCRFCGQGTPTVKFKNDAHAVPNLLGNKSLFTMNECDECNRSLGQKYEDHLGKWSNLMRAVRQVPGKKNKKPSFQSKDGKLRIDSTDSGLKIRVPSPQTVADLFVNGIPELIELTGDTSSQPYVPIRAAMALVKAACSICPTEDLEQCRNAIDWLMERKRFLFSRFPVLVAFTPGPINEKASEVFLLRRKGCGAEPYLWCVIQFSNFRLQIFVPGCPTDEFWSREASNVEVTCEHYPSQFGPKWRFGPTQFSRDDWSSAKLTTTAPKVIQRVIKVIGVTPPLGEPT
jgi:hypothetical protein